MLRGEPSAADAWQPGSVWPVLVVAGRACSKLCKSSKSGNRHVVSRITSLHKCTSSYDAYKAMHVLVWSEKDKRSEDVVKASGKKRVMVSPETPILRLLPL